MGIDPNSLDAEMARRQQEADLAATPDTTDQEIEAEPTIDQVRLAGGERVVTSDGKEIGSVRSLVRGYFSLDCSAEDDFWLSTIYVASAGDGRAMLTFPAHEMEDHRLRQPGLETLDGHLTRFGTVHQTRAEALRAREQMEHEMLEQRGTIDTDVRNPV